MSSVKETYFTAFVIFFRLISWGWTPRTRVGLNTCAAASAATITVIEFWFLVAIVGWVETRFLEVVPKWAAAIAFMALFGANCYHLVVLRQGLIFERGFRHFKGSKKVLLVAASLGVMLAAIMFFLYSVFVHRMLLGH